MIRYNPVTGRARAKLFSTYNDVDVFVEDVATQNLYVRLLGRMLGPQRSVQSVIALGGKKNVLQQCRADQATRGRPRLYIIDGDLDLLCGMPKPRLKHLYRLNVYCSENLVSTEHAAVSVAQDGMTSKGYQEVRDELRCDVILETAERSLKGLFILYATIHKLGLAIPTVSVPIQRFLAEAANPNSISGRRIMAHMRDLLRQVYRVTSRRRYVSARRVVRRQIAKVGGWSLRFVSGKKYILPLLQIQLKEVAGVQAAVESMAVRLAAHCEPDVDPGLRRAVRRSLRQSRVTTVQSSVAAGSSSP